MTPLTMSIDDRRTARAMSRTNPIESIAPAKAAAIMAAEPTER